MSTMGIITKDSILGGKPIIKGTRISVESIISYLINDLDIEDIKIAYPFLTNEQIKAALDYADSQLTQKRAKVEPQTS